MWIRRAVVEGLHAEREKLREEQKHEARRHHEQVLGLERMNARLQSDLDWFKLRLNAVEKERAQLVSASLGIKIAVPEFQPVTDGKKVADAFAEMPDLTSVGGNAKEDDDRPDMAVMLDGIGGETPVDYSMMPGFNPARRPR